MTSYPATARGWPGAAAPAGERSPYLGLGGTGSAVSSIRARASTSLTLACTTAGCTAIGMTDPRHERADAIWTELLAHLSAACRNLAAVLNPSWH